jgi:hypothetical protein
VPADTIDMMISKEQARAAAVLLRNRGVASIHASATQVSPAVIAAACAVAESTPDMSSQRMADGRDYLENHTADSRVVASMMIQRIISDSLR